MASFLVHNPEMDGQLGLGHKVVDDIHVVDLVEVLVVAGHERDHRGLLDVLVHKLVLVPGLVVDFVDPSDLIVMTVH
eukprot:851658-Prorocentrum_lima.AAC.1